MGNRTALQDPTINKKTAWVHQSAPGPVLERKRTAMGGLASWQNDPVFPAGSPMTWWTASLVGVELVGTG